MTHRAHAWLTGLTGLTIVIFQLIAFVALLGTDAVGDPLAFVVSFTAIVGFLLLAHTAYSIYRNCQGGYTVIENLLYPWSHRHIRAQYFSRAWGLYIVFTLLFWFWYEQIKDIEDISDPRQLGFENAVDGSLIFASFSMLLPLTVRATILEIGYSGDHQKHGFRSAY